MEFLSLINKQSVIITLDVNASLFNRLQSIEDAGFSVVELNNVEQQILTDVIKRHPSLRVGASNIINTDQLEAVQKAGAHFGSSPGFMPSLIQTANIYDFHYLPGVATPSEAMQAAALGCQHVRPLPATLSFCRLLNKYLPNLRLFPADVTEEEADKLLLLNSVSAVSVLNPELERRKTIA
ncbi:MAG: bifunctional 4-hydroxy-2-oxoglutarate aldolase/2-dehydro-3-deoxy-phosphogluconate aldolase [Legionella sp.]|jgi:2-dehydro-3-deoxyphosphogluconate aldolase/(4S)-4-hydroxy-2-oxoglutarate aldolase|nr:bifunctional 4-hydroxy-2-oxoglutarate aldolase/2-dehydro-3-deoxy-phosphogluconate aldolase [Legionella sp.]